MPDQVPVHVARERNRILRELGAEKNRAFRQRFVGQSLDVITLHAGGNGWTEALSDNFLKVRVEGQRVPNAMMRVGISALDAAGLRGVGPQ